MRTFPFELVALVATANRPQLLATRSLPSILTQTLTPNRIVVVDDSELKSHPKTQRAIAKTKHSDRIELLRNRRTPGASGAWNSGLDHILRTSSDPRSVFVAILDDDDEWTPDYLRRCAMIASESQADMVSSAFIRQEKCREPKIVVPPETLRRDDFLTGNPGIQGSNLFIKLSTILEAGLFDENLASCTDRDLCIRLCELPDICYANQPITTVRHHASSTRPRLSSPNLPAKRKGLECFYQKYAPQMTNSQKQRFLDRALRYFSWEPTAPSSPTPNEVILADLSELHVDHQLALAVGVIVDPNRVGSAARLLEDLHILSCDPAVVGLDVLLIENGAGWEISRPFVELVKSTRSKGLNVYAMTRDIIREDHEAGRIEAPECAQGERMGIARARTVLQSYLYALLCRRPGAVGWILDDDMHLEALTQQQGEAIRWKPPYVQTLARAKAEGVTDIGIGPYTGAPPLPFASCLRGQMVDLVHTLRRWSRLSSKALLPPALGMNTRLAEGRRDFYYDLSRIETDRLETPFNFTFARPEESVAEVFSQLAKRFERILAGEQLFRPLIQQGQNGHCMPDGSPLQRGGNTFIFNPEVLADIPNPCLLTQGRPMRRSDMLWSLAQQHLNGRTVRTLSLPVYHDRSGLQVEGLDSEKVIDDIRGYAFYSALQDRLNEGDQKGKVGSSWISHPDIDAFTSLVEKYAKERLAAFTLSFWRVRGCAKSALHFLEHPDLQDTSWIHGNEFVKERTKLGAVLQRILAMYNPEELRRITQGIDALDSAHVESLLEELPQQYRAHRRRLKDITPLVSRIHSQRMQSAQHHVRRLLGINGDLRILGHGCEGVALTDGCKVFKVFDYWKSREARRQIQFLASKVCGWTGTKGLYPLESLIKEDGIAILTYPYEDSTPYTGGNGPGLIDLLVECHENGIVCRNIHPKNLRKVDEKVRLIDYGSDIHQLHSESEFEMMCRRAWLSWRYPHRNDLSEVMKAALTDDSLPELAGFEYFMEAVRQRIQPGIGYYNKIVDIVERLSPERVLDYGCGKGNILGQLGRNGISGIGYDPDPCLRPIWDSRWNEIARHVGFLSERSSLNDMKFDTVICTRVLCALDDDAYTQAISDLRQMTKTGGTVVVSVCDPEFINVRHTAEATKSLNRTISENDGSLRWEKLLASGKTRIEFYRPRRKLIRDLALVGLTMVDEFEIPTIDMDRFEPASEVRVFVLKALPRLPEISVMIKCCAMETATLEVQVQHLIRQLEGPRAFAERLLVVDERAEGFLRQYASGNMRALEEACARLLEGGWIDRIVYGPQKKEDIVALNTRWFGIRTDATHSQAGPQTASTLSGFEECRTQFLLQVDSDLMVGRKDHTHDYLADMLQVFADNPTAATVAFNICNTENKPYTSQSFNGPWRTEVRGSMIHMERFRALAPFPNAVTQDGLEQTWYRAADQRMRIEKGCSWRGGDKRTFFIHPPNERKADTDTWLAILDRVEKGMIPSRQNGHVDLQGTLEDWFAPLRDERFIFIIGGKDVSPGRFMRCLNSITKQQRKDWGCIVIDDASSPELAQYIQRSCSKYSDKISVFNIRKRRGLLANMIWTIRLACANPRSIIVTVDADDMLLSDRTLDRLHEVYQRGADLTVGSMLRTDKHVHYPIDFNDPRGNRGGNVWQHLRSFRKYLFDAVPESMFELKGKHIDLATDWAYMLPMVELAKKPVHIRHPLYLYEPSGTGKGADTQRREDIIAQIVAKEPLSAQPTQAT